MLGTEPLAPPLASGCPHTTIKRPSSREAGTSRVLQEIDLLNILGTMFSTTFNRIGQIEELHWSFRKDDG